MAYYNTSFNSLVTKVSQEKATKENKYNVYKTWYAWITKHVLHVVSESKVAERDIWHFDLRECTGKEFVFKNTTGTATCWVQLYDYMEPNPYIRLGRICNISKKDIRFHKEGEEVKFWQEYREAKYCLPVGNDCVTTDIQPKEANDFTKSSGWAFVKRQQRTFTGRVVPQVNELHIWGEPDPEPLGEAIATWLYKEGTSLEFLMAKARGEVPQLLKSKIKETDLDYVISIDDEEYMVDKRLGKWGLYLYPTPNESQHCMIRYFNDYLPQEKAIALLPLKVREFVEELA